MSEVAARVSFDTAYRVRRDLEILREVTPRRIQWDQLSAEDQREAISICGIDLCTLFGEMSQDLLLRLECAYHADPFDAAEFGLLVDKYLRMTAEPLVLQAWDSNRTQRDLFMAGGK